MRIFNAVMGLAFTVFGLYHIFNNEVQLGFLMMLMGKLYSIELDLDTLKKKE